MIDRITLSLAGEYAVASELCRRGVNAHVVMGHAKRSDVLAYSEGGKAVILEVKTKQGGSWPNCRGTSSGRFLVLVDVAGKSEKQRPDFYVLTFQDWKNLVNLCCKEGVEEGSIEIDQRDRMYVPVWVKQKKAGKLYTGMGISPHQLSDDHKDAWLKIAQALQEGSV